MEIYKIKHNSTEFIVEGAGYNLAGEDEAAQAILELIYIDALHAAGCKDEKPLLGYRPGVGPRCRLCNTVAEIEK